jgi:hypothetical protein
MTSPTEKPKGCPAPRDANAMLRYDPSGMVLVINKTEEGRQKEIATPWAARNKISSIPVLERPQAIVVITKKNSPRRYIFRPPTMSAMDPDKMRVQPLARELTEAGQSRRFPDRFNSFAIVGRLTTRIPPNIELIKEINAMVPMIIVAFHFEIESALPTIEELEDS